jgi:hypothetical protein
VLIGEHAGVAILVHDLHVVVAVIHKQVKVLVGVHVTAQQIMTEIAVIQVGDVDVFDSPCGFIHNAEGVGRLGVRNGKNSGVARASVFSMVSLLCEVFQIKLATPLEAGSHSRSAHFRARKIDLRESLPEVCKSLLVSIFTACN